MSTTPFITSVQADKKIQDSYFALEQQIDIANTGSDLGLLKVTDSPPPTGKHRGDVQTAGTYTNFGGIVFTQEELDNNYGFIYVEEGVFTKNLSLKKDGKDGKGAYQSYLDTTTDSPPMTESEWSASFDVSDKVDKNDVFIYNKFDKTDLSGDGFYINNTSGALMANATSRVSPWIPVISGSTYYMSGKTLTNTAVRFKDINGTILKPINLAGIPLSDFIYSSVNGAIKAPATAVSFQMTVILGGVGTVDNVQFIESSVFVDYMPVGEKIIKKELITFKTNTGGSTKTAKDLENQIDSIVNGNLINRINKNENTLTPQAFPSVTEVVNNMGISVVVDTDSPVKDLVGYKRILSNTLTPNVLACFRLWGVPLGIERPTTISFAFWTKRTELSSIYNANFPTIFGFQWATNIADLLAGLETYETKTGGATNIVSATNKCKVIAEDGDYIRIRVVYTDIIWVGGFVGTTLPFYFQFNFNNSNGKQLTIVDFTTLFNVIPNGSFVYPDGNGIIGTPTLKGSYRLAKENADNIKNLQNASGAVQVKKVGNKLYVATSFSDTQNLVKEIDYLRPSNFTNNPNANFVQSFLTTKGGDIISGTLLKSEGDDITPANLNGSYIAGGHSWNQGRNVVANAHEKTLADVGSIYKDASNKEFIILRIVDANNLWMVSRNQVVDNSSYSFLAPSGTLTYVSNGTNTASIVVSSSATLGNTMTTITPSITKLMLDGTKEIIEDGTYYCNFLDLREYYNALDLTSIINQIIINRPVGGYLTQPLLNSLIGTDPLFSHNLNYRFTKNGNTVLTTEFRTFKALSFSFHGFIQSIALGSGNLYIPKSLPFVAGAKTYDFRTLENWTTPPTVAINLTSAYWENPISPPDRVINQNTSLSIMLGYITDRGLQANRKDVVDNSMFLGTTRKVYPMGASIAQSLPANSFFSTVAYRCYSNPAFNPVGRTNYAYVEVGSDVFVFLDYHGSLNDSVNSEVEWIGKKITVYEKNSKCTLIGDVVSNKINVISSASASNYGFIVLKIS